MITDDLTDGKFSIYFTRPEGTTHNLKQVVLRETDDLYRESVVAGLATNPDYTEE